MAQPKNIDRPRLNLDRPPLSGSYRFVSVRKLFCCARNIFDISNTYRLQVCFRRNQAQLAVVHAEILPESLRAWSFVTHSECGRAKHQPLPSVRAPGAPARGQSAVLLLCVLPRTFIPELTSLPIKLTKPTFSHFKLQFELLYFLKMRYVGKQSSSSTLGSTVLLTVNNNYGELFLRNLCRF